MLNDVAITKQIRVAFDERYPIEGEVVGIERGEDEEVQAVLIRAPHVEGGTIYFLSEDLAAAEVTFPKPVLN